MDLKIPSFSRLAPCGTQFPACSCDICVSEVTPIIWQRGVSFLNITINTIFFMSAGQVERTSNSFFVAANCQKCCKKSHLLNCRLSKSSCQLIWPAEHVINPCQAASKWEGDLRYDPRGTHQRARRYFGMLTLDCKKKTVSHAAKSISSGKQVGPWKQNRPPVVLPSVDFTHLSDTNVSACFALPVYRSPVAAIAGLSNQSSYYLNL